METKFKFGHIKSIDSDSRTVTFVVSDGQVDRHGDSINPEGWMVENYMKNPVVLFGHDYKTLPIGKTIKLWVENGAELLATMKFATHEFAQKVWDLIEGDFLNATSVGFIPLKLDEEGNYTWAQQELLEISVVPVPANPRALSRKAIEICKSLEEETGMTILKDGDENTDDHNDAPPADTDPVTDPETTEPDMKTLVKEAVLEALGEYQALQKNEQVEAEAQAATKQKEALAAMRDHLKSSDKALGQALRKLKEITK